MHKYSSIQGLIAYLSFANLGECLKMPYACRTRSSFVRTVVRLSAGIDASFGCFMSGKWLLLSLLRSLSLK